MSPLISPRSLRTLEGYSVEVWLYTDGRMPIRFISSWGGEMWEAEVDAPYIPEVKQSWYEKYKSGASTSQNEEPLSKRTVAYALMDDLKFNGYYETLGVKFGVRPEHVTVKKIIRGVSVVFKRDSIYLYGAQPTGNYTDQSEQQEPPRAAWAKAEQQEFYRYYGEGDGSELQCLYCGYHTKATEVNGQKISAKELMHRHLQSKHPEKYVPPRQPTSTSQQSVNNTSQKIQYGLGSENLRKLRLTAYRIIDDTDLKVPKSRIEQFILVSLDSKYKFLDRNDAYKRSVNDLIEWFKRNTTPKT